MQDLVSMGQSVGGLLKKSGQTIAISESSAGGLISAALLAVPGASAYYLGGGILYTYDSRRILMALSDDVIEGVRPSTEEYALHMARATRERLGATWGVGETGAAGPAGNRYGDAPGHVCIAVSGPEAEEAITLETGRDDRETNMWAFSNAALELLERILKKNS